MKRQSTEKNRLVDLRKQAEKTTEKDECQQHQISNIIVPLVKTQIGSVYGQNSDFIKQIDNLEFGYSLYGGFSNQHFNEDKTVLIGIIDTVISKIDEQNTMSKTPKSPQKDNVTTLIVKVLLALLSCGGAGVSIYKSNQTVEIVNELKQLQQQSQQQNVQQNVEVKVMNGQGGVMQQ